MMVLSHVFVGGAIGQSTGNPYLAFILGFISHLVIDKVPHFWPKTKKYGRFFTWFDIFASLGLMLVFWLIGFQSTSFWAGIVGSVSLDCMAMGAKFLGKIKFYYWQERRQPHIKKPIYLLTDVFFVLTSLLILWNKK